MMTSSNGDTGKYGTTWLVSHELCYEDINDGDVLLPSANGFDSLTTRQKQVCFFCEKKEGEKPLLKCSKCRVASYCSKQCQINDWKTISSSDSTAATVKCERTSRSTKRGCHKESCMFFSRLIVTENLIIQLRFDQDKADAKDEILYRIRFYLEPYSIYKYEKLGPGILFVQSDHTLAMMSLPNNTSNYYGAPIIRPRSLLIHYLTFPEYDMEVCRDDFEMACVRNEVKDAIDRCNNFYKDHEDTNSSNTIAVLMRFRCGHIAVGTIPLSLDYCTCVKLGQDYFTNNNSNALQLNIDDA